MAVALGIFFALLQADWALGLGRLTVYHTELALLLLAALGWRRLGGAWPAAFAPLGLWILAHAFGPSSPWEAVKGLLRPLEFALALALPASGIRDARGLRFVMRAVFFAGILSCLWALAQAALGPGSALNQGRESEVIWGFQAAAAGMGHHNQLGAFLAAFLCLAAGAALAGVERPWALAALAFGAAALLASYSRGAWAGALLAFLMLVFLLPKKLRLAFLAAGALLLLAGLFGPSEAFRTRLGSLGRDPDRAAYLRAAWGLWDGHALWGWGTAGLHAALLGVAESLPLSPEARQAFSSHLHNSYLQFGLEWGAPALALGALFFMAPAMAALKSASRPFGLALLAAMAAFFLQAATDLVALHARGMAVAFCWGLMLAGLRLEREGEPHGS
jgi:O-antigen ligase